MDRDHGQSTTAAARRVAVRNELYDTVARLTAVTDSATLVRVLCRDVRSALRCELTYIATSDDGEESITAITASGEPAVRFSSVRTGRSVGVAGLVVSTGRMFATSNYWGDNEFNHDPEIDAILKKEGLVAYAAAPLVADGKTIGALLAAERHEREFTQFDLELLSEIASVAGPALRRVQESEDTEEELRSLRSSTRRAEAFRSSVFDPLGAVAAGTASSEVRELILDSISTSFGVHASIAKSDASAAPERGWRYAKEIPNAGRIARFLHVETPEKPTDGWLAAATESAALVLGVVGQMEESRAAADERTRGELLQDFLAGRSPRYLADSARKLGVEEVLEEAAALVIIPSKPNRRGLRSMEVMRLVKKFGGLVEDQGTRVIFLIPNRELGQRSKALTETFLGETGDGYAGLSAVGTPARYPELIVEATSLAVASKNMGAQGAVANAASFGFVGAALSSDDARADMIIRKEIEPVITYDKDRGTDLIATMHCYVRNNFNARLTADELVIHPKTVSQRLARISALLGPDWAQYPRSLNVASALEILRIRESLGGSNEN